ncbi:MAG: hypothetical protein RSD77_07550 [Romboutsia sp.]
MHEKIKNIATIEDLKKLGSIEVIIEIIEEIIKPIKIKATSYEDLFEYIKVLQHNWIDFGADEFFKSEESKYLFCLTQVDGKKRNAVIGLTDDLYDDKSLAKKWYRNIAKIIRSDIKTDDKTKNAFNELHKLYKTIMSSFEEED